MIANVLIAHSDPYTIRAIQIVLRDDGHTFQVARDGLDVIDRALDNAPHALLLGLTLTGLDGLDVARALRALEPTRYLPILFLARNVEQAAEIERAGIGLTDWMVEPLDLAQLRDHLDRMLRPSRTVAPRAGAEPQLSTIRDPLTGVYERPYILHRLAYEASRAARYHTHLSCILLRVANFPERVEKLGRVAADRLLAELADLLRQTVRGADILGRTRPDEFLIIAPHTDQNGGRQFADRIQQRVADPQWEFAQGDDPVRILVGVAWAPGPNLSENLSLLTRAEAALARAQAEGTAIA